MTIKELINKIVVGDLLTHTRCMGSIEEHLFTGFDGEWICGKATKETIKYGGSKTTNDIAPANVTHINRELVMNMEIILS